MLPTATHRPLGTGLTWSELAGLYTTAHPPPAAQNAPQTPGPFVLYRGAAGYQCPLQGCDCAETRPSELMLHLTVQKRHPLYVMRQLEGTRVDFADRLPDAPDGIPTWRFYKHGFIGKPHVVCTDAQNMG